MKKKLLSFALALVMCLGLTVPAMAAGYTEAIPCQYERVGNFSEGLAAVAVQSETYESSQGDYRYRWGFIDKSGNEAIPCKYLWVTQNTTQTETDNNPRFSEGLAVVVIYDGTEYKVTNYHGKVCFIDQTGKEVIPAKYDTASNFSEGLAMVGVYNESYQDWLGKHYRFTCGFIDKTGNEVVPLKYDAAYDFSEGLAAVRVGSDSATWKWGFIDKTGKEVISPRPYRLVRNFSEGLAAVAVMEDNKPIYGFIDQTGNEVIPCQYTLVEDFSEGLAMVIDKNEKCSFIDKTGKEVISLQYGGSAFSEGLAVVALEEYRANGYIDKTGREVFSTRYLAGTKNFSEGFAAVTQGYNHWGYIDKTGKEVVPCQYLAASSVSEGMAAVAVVGSVDEHYNKTFKWGFISFDGGTSAPEQEQPTSGPQVSNWAKEQVSRAAENGLVPDGLGNNYQANITRSEFAATAVKLYEAMSGQKAPAAGGSPFTDTSDPAVIQAEALGIVSGVGDGKFAPDALVTREQAALMLSRVYTKLGGNIPEVSATTFADNDKVSGWARDAVAFMADKGIVSGVGNNQFGPQGNASIEQALVIALRMFDNLK